MFVIFGTRTREKMIRTEQFYCSKCATQRDGKLKQIGKWFTLFCIPIFQYENVGKYLECEVCHRSYKPLGQGKAA